MTNLEIHNVCAKVVLCAFVCYGVGKTTKQMKTAHRNDPVSSSVITFHFLLQSNPRNSNTQWN